jgi:preprotein translocase subunit YajC
MGTMAAVVEAASSKSSSSGYEIFIFIILAFVLLYFMMIRPQRRRQQQAQSQQNKLTPGARVRTTAGMYATVSAVDGDDVILEVAPGVDVRYMRRAVMEVVAPGEPEADETVEDAEPEDTDGYAEHEDTDGYAEDDLPEDTDASHEHDGAEPAEDGHADSRNGNLAKSDKDNVF